MHTAEIIGREYEWDTLEERVSRDEAQLIVVYGRRRVGKTYFINEFFHHRFDFKFTGIYKQPAKVQLFGFSEELSRQSGEKHPVPQNWINAFSMLREYLEAKPEKEKQVVFFDEIPWMDTPRSGFLSAFEWFWNSWGSARHNLIFVICGSATSWMVENIDQNRGGLYNRATCRMYLKPFNLYETEKYLQSRGIIWTRYKMAECYMIMGGIPYYLSLLRPDLTFEQNIDNIFFKDKSELFDEFNNLYHTLFKNSADYIRVVDVLSTKKSGYTRDEIVAKTRLANNGNLTKILNNLEYSGFIRITRMFNKKKKDMVYQLADYYTAFYYKYIKDNYGTDEHFWSNSAMSPARNTWAGLTFEQLCRDHVRQIKKKLGISGILSDVTSWRKKKDEESDGAEIDLLIDRRDQVINVCEIKYANGEYVIDKEYDRVLRNKVETFRHATDTKKALHLTMITTYGVKRNMYGNEIVFQVTLDDLFENGE